MHTNMKQAPAQDASTKPLVKGDIRRPRTVALSLRNVDNGYVPDAHDVLKAVQAGGIWGQLPNEHSRR